MEGEKEGKRGRMRNEFAVRVVEAKVALCCDNKLRRSETKRRKEKREKESN